jgi:hypothetical protein
MLDDSTAVPSKKKKAHRHIATFGPLSDAPGALRFLISIFCRFLGACPKA